MGALSQGGLPTGRQSPLQSSVLLTRESWLALGQVPCITRIVLETFDLLLRKCRQLLPKLSPGNETDQDAFTGERFLPGYVDGSIELEHVHRYCFALPFVVDRNVLDIACGEGYGSDLLAQAATTVIGVDIDEPSISLARRRYTRPNLSFRTGSATAIPLEDHSVDAVISFETIEHLEEHDTFWSEIKRVLTTDGILIVSSPNRDAYRDQRVEPNPFHKRELSQDELVKDLSRHFAHYRLFSQSIVFGSLLVPRFLDPLIPYVISLDPETQVLEWEIGDEWSHPYSVAIASDDAIDATGQSLYTGRYPAGAMSSLMGGIVERDQRAQKLQNQIAQLEVSVARAQYDRDEVQSEATQLKGALGERDNEVSALEALLRDRDEAILAARAAEETLAGQIRLLTAQRDEAILAARSADESLTAQMRLLTAQRDQALNEASRVREILTEQDGIIGALKVLLEECS